jgi:hypothetical protein
LSDSSGGVSDPEHAENNRSTDNKPIAGYLMNVLRVGCCHIDAYKNRKFLSIKEPDNHSARIYSILTIILRIQVTSH